MGLHLCAVCGHNLDKCTCYHAAREAIYMSCVLIVEDEARIRDIVRDYFVSHGLGCDLARNGAAEAATRPGSSPAGPLRSTRARAPAPCRASR